MTGGPDAKLALKLLQSNETSMPEQEEEKEELMETLDVTATTVELHREKSSKTFSPTELTTGNNSRSLLRPPQNRTTTAFEIPAMDAGAVTAEAEASLVTVSTRRQEAEDQVQAAGTRVMAVALMPFMSGENLETGSAPEFKSTQHELGSQPQTPPSNTKGGDMPGHSRPPRLQTASAAKARHGHNSRAEVKEKDIGGTTKAIFRLSRNNVLVEGVAAETGCMQAAAARAGASIEEPEVKTEMRGRSVISEGIRIRPLASVVHRKNAAVKSNGWKPWKRRSSYKFSNWKASVKRTGFRLGGRSSRAETVNSTTLGPKTKEETSEEAELEISREGAEVWKRVMQKGGRAEYDNKRVTTGVAEPEKGREEGT